MRQREMPHFLAVVCSSQRQASDVRVLCHIGVTENFETRFVFTEGRGAVVREGGGGQEVYA